MNTRFRADSIRTGSKSTKMWDQDTEQGAIEVISTQRLTNAVVHGYSNIPQNYRDLMLVVNGTMSADSPLVLDSVTNPSAGAVTFTGSSTYMHGTGAVASGSKANNLSGFTALTTGTGAFFKSNVPSTMILHIMNYTNTSYQKTFIAKCASDANGSGLMWYVSGLIGGSTAAIGGFNLSTQNGGIFFTSGTSTLYGIKG